MTTKTFTVTGMTCGHCVAAVRDELGKIAGVRRVDVDLGSGNVTLTSDAPVDDQVIAEAVDEGGYVGAS
jgi:copper ion binding protein